MALIFSELESLFRDFTLATMPITVAKSRRVAKKDRKSFFLFLEMVLSLPESDIPAESVMMMCGRGKKRGVKRKVEKKRNKRVYQ